MRTHRATRRNATKTPVEIPIEYEVDEPELDPTTQEPTGRTATVVKLEKFICRGDISALTMSEFSNVAAVEVATPEGAAMLRTVFEEAFGDEREYQRFYQFARKHLEDDDLIEVMSDLIEEMSDRPTQPPSPSPAPSSTSGEPSRDGSSQQAPSGLVVAGTSSQA